MVALLGVASILVVGHLNVKDMDREDHFPFALNLSVKANQFSEAPQRGWLARMASLPRRMVHAMAKDVGARLFGGETLMVLARHRGMP